MKATDLSCYYKKALSFYHNGLSLEFQTTQSLFSSHQIDIGTQHLIKSLDTSTQQDQILDLGCGYGPLGIWAGKAMSASTIHLVDRDALAVAFSKENARLNGLSNVSAYGSLGYDQIPVGMRFDLILSNIPGKAGKAVIDAMLLDARAWLNPMGTVAIVIVSPLEAQVMETLSHPDVHIKHLEQFNGYTVIHYQFTQDEAGQPAESSIVRGLYERGSLEIEIEGDVLSLHTARGLAEFESLSFDTELTLKVLQKMDPEDVRAIHCVNAGQGILPVYLTQVYDCPVTLFDRDLLALTYTQRNLIENGCPLNLQTSHHQAWYTPDPDACSDLTVFKLREDESTEVQQQHIANAILGLSTKGSLIVAGGSTPVTRLNKWLDSQKTGRIAQRKRNKGQSVIIVQRR